jgi:hypothetical protein
MHDENAEVIEMGTSTGEYSFIHSLFSDGISVTQAIWRRIK